VYLLSVTQVLHWAGKILHWAGLLGCCIEQKLCCFFQQVSCISIAAARGKTYNEKNSFAAALSRTAFLLPNYL
jgi:hypothetical protein